jgi:hypothetical protein
VRRFPDDFAELLNVPGRRFLREHAQLPQFRERAATPIAYFDGFIPDVTAHDAIRILDASLLPHMREHAVPLAPNWRRTQRRNYAERLGKTVRNLSASLNSSGSLAYRAATDCGLLAMMRSKAFRRFAEVVTGARLRPNGRQVISYRHGDFVGPHNDHHPEIPHLRDGYVDLHISFSNASVQSQTLVYESGGFLSAAIPMEGLSGITVYRLPFWHYASPLVGRRDREASARRWLILGSFEILA